MDQENTYVWVVIICLAIGLFLGYNAGKNRNDYSEVLEENTQLTEKIEEYEECLWRSRDAVENAIDALEASDYGDPYEAIGEAQGFLEDTDFCGL